MTRNPIVTDFIARRDREVAKAVEKYGAIALAPGGHPAYDIMDYMINELVGLVRYAQMVEHRFVDTRVSALTKPAQAVVADGITVARQVEGIAGRLAYDVIAVHQRARALGLLDGTAE